MQLSARLSFPPGTNSAYQPNRRVSKRQRGLRTSDEVNVWKELAALELRKQGWKALPKLKRRHYTLRLVFHLYTWRSDLDHGDKFAIDAVCSALGVNDYWVQERTTYKHSCKKEDEHMDVVVTIED